MTVTLEQQLEYEAAQRSLGRSKMAMQLASAKEDGRITDTPLGTGVLRRYLLWMSARIAKDITVDLGEPGRSKAYSPLLKDLDPDAVALIAISELLRLCAQGSKNLLSSVGFAIGRGVYGELALASFRDMSPNLYETLTQDLQRKMSKDLRHKLTIFRLQAKENGFELPEWSPSQKLQVGTYLLGLMEENEESAGLCTQRLVREGNKTKYHIELLPHVSRYMDSVEASMIQQSGFAAPCLIPPQDWTADEDNQGGFHGDLKIRAVRYFKGTTRQLEIMNTEGNDSRMTLDMLNAHQRVSWKVNPFVLEVVKGMRKLGYETKTVATTAAYPAPERPGFLDTKDKSQFSAIEQSVFDTWKSQKRDWHTKIKQVARVELRLNLVLAAAQELSSYAALWFVYQICNRGRMYPNSGPLNPQGADVQKALLHSATGGKIDTPEALEWFKLSLAAKYGIDKLSPEACIKWVDDNHDNIIRAASNPLDRDAWYWWREADKPLQFIAVCDEYRRYHEDPEGFIARIAVSMDGTCNGLQNYSALCRDEIGGRATNLISAESGIPNDIYGDVAKASFKRLASMPVSTLRTAWTEHGFNRKLTKKSVMTQVYGSTFSTCRKSVMEYCYENELFQGEEFEHSEYAAKLVWVGIGDVVVKGKEAMDWLREGAGAVMREGAEYISWPTPTGHRVVQIYDKCKMIRVVAHIGKRIALKVPGDEVVGPDKMRHRNALPPNFIHSIDSAHMAFVSVRLQREQPEGIFMHFIHDDFGTLPHNAVLLAKVIREEFVNMHTGYSLDNFRNEYPFIKEPPKLGNLDINCVLTSINFFR